MKRAHIEFMGDVHGTGYRSFLNQKALELGLKGFCKTNGQNIEVEIEGTTSAVDEFIHYIEKGISAQAETHAFKLQTFDTLVGYKRMESDIM